MSKCKGIFSTILVLFAGNIALSATSTGAILNNKKVDKINASFIKNSSEYNGTRNGVSLTIGF